MNKTDLIQKVKALDGLSQDERAYLINLVNTKKKYGLVWEDKPEDVEEQLRDNLPVLKEVKDKAIINGEDNPNHILIEGDNLHALTALTFTHEGAIDVIYIDPPYNTGNKDFVYNDHFVDKEDSYRHSKWLSFMDKRLRIAKRLLSETGVIFISIDENEFAQLKLLCNNIFGEEYFVGCFIWHKKYGGGGDNKNVVAEHEYILTYSKDKPTDKQVINGIDLDFEDFAGYALDEDNRYFSSNESILMRGPNSTPEKRPNLCYEITDPDGNKILPRDGKGTWCYSKNTLQYKLKNNELIWKEVKGLWMLYKKQFFYRLVSHQPAFFIW
jgi:adenine-specific DNA-methyltransferase